MVDITLTIPDDVKDRVINGFCGQFRYQETVEDGVDEDGLPVMVVNPESKPVFAKRMLAKVIKDTVRTYEANQASETARLAAIASADELGIQ